MGSPPFREGLPTRHYNGELGPTGVLSLLVAASTIPLLDEGGLYQVVV